MQFPSTATEQVLVVASSNTPFHLINLSSGAQSLELAPPASHEPPTGRGHVVILLSVVYLVIFVIGVAGNLCNCLVIADAHNRYMKSATNYYLFSLSVSDLLLLIFGIPHDLVDLWHPSSYLFNEFVCISRGWISEASTNASVLVIVAFTMERYLAICHPLRLRTFSRLSRSVKMIVLIWLLASTSAFLVVRRFGLVTTDQLESTRQHPPQSQAANETAPVVLCTTLNQMESASDFERSVLVFFVIPMLVISVLYIRICCYLRHKTNIIMRSRKMHRQQQQWSPSTRVDTTSVGGEEEIEDERPPHTTHFSTTPSLNHHMQRTSAPPASPKPLQHYESHQPPPEVEMNLQIIAAAAQSPATSGEHMHNPQVQWCPMLVAGQPLIVTSDADSLGRDSVGGAGREKQVATYSQDNNGNLAVAPEAARKSRPPRGSVSGPKPALQSTVNTANLQSVIKMLVSVVVMFFICWAPFHAQRLMAVYVTDPTPDQEFIYAFLNHISGISYYISAVANPILYSLFSVKFRQAFRDTFGRLANKRRAA